MSIYQVKIEGDDLVVEETNALLIGDIDTGKSLIKDYLNATEVFVAGADQLQKDENSIRRMLGSSGNPTLKNFHRHSQGL